MNSEAIVASVSNQCSNCSYQMKSPLDTDGNNLNCHLNDTAQQVFTVWRDPREPSHPKTLGCRTNHHFQPRYRKYPARGGVCVSRCRLFYCCVLSRFGMSGTLASCLIVNVFCGDRDVVVVKDKHGCAATARVVRRHYRNVVRLPPGHLPNLPDHNNSSRNNNNNSSDERP